MKLKTLLGGALAVLLILFALPNALACGGGSDDDTDDACPDYTVEATGEAVGHGDVGAAFNERGQFAVYGGDQYVFWDYTLGVTGTKYLWSIWFYSEANGEPGPQRHDDYCQQAPPEDADVMWC